MDIESYIVARANILLNTQDTQIVKRLEGGMSNYTYIIQSGGKRYTYRVPGKYASNFVDRTDECAHIQAVEALDFCPKTLYMEIRSGEKIAEYLDGTILSDTDVAPYNSIAAEALKKLHNSGLQFKEYNPFGRLANYERYCNEQGYTHPEAYRALRAKLDEMRIAYTQVKLVPCHCDFQTSNLVLSDGKLFVLDWEFAGMNDPYYDIACYGNAGLDKAEALLAAYVGHEPTAEDLKRMYFQRAFQCIQWNNVAIFKDRIGLSKDLNMDFDAVADMFFQMAEDLIERYDSL